MAIQILPQEENQYGRLAELLGLGLGRGVGGIAREPLRKAEQEKNIESLKGLGFSEQEARAISAQPANVQQDIIKNRMATQSQLMSQQQKLNAQNQSNQLFSALASGDTGSLMNLLGGLGSQEQIPGQEQMTINPDQRLQLGSQLLSPQQYSALEKSIRGGQKLELQKEATESKDIASRQKLFSKLKTRINDDYKSYNHDKHTLELIKNVSEKGDLSSPKYISLLRKLGLDVDALMTNDDTVLIKLRNEFLPSLKTIFGGRVTNLDLEQFLKGIPDLTQTKEGRGKLVNILGLINEGKKSYYDAMKKIEKKHGDKLPYNFESLLQDSAQKDLDRIGSQLNSLYNFGGTSEQQDNQQLSQPQQQQVIPSINQSPSVPRAQSPQGEAISNAIGGAARQVIRPTLAAASSVGSIPRNIVDLATSVIPQIDVADIPEDVRKLLPEDSIRQIEEYQKNPQPLRSLLQSVSEYLPSQDQIKKAFGHYLPEGYINPQNSSEEFIDDVVSDAASLMVGGGAGAAKSLITAGLGNIAKIIPKSLGFSKGVQEGSKIGVMMLTSLGMGPKLKDAASNLYGEAEALTAGKRLPTDKIIETASNIEKKYLSSGLNTEDKRELANVIGQIKERVPSQNVKDFDLRDIWQIKKDMVEPIDNVKRGSEAQKYLFELRSAIDQSLKNSPNKEFSTLLTKADKLYEGVKNGSSANKFIKDSFKKHGIVLGAAGAYPLVTSLISNPLGTLGAVGLPWLGANGILMANNILKNSEVRNQYVKFITAAAKNNAPALIKAAKNIEKSSK